MPTGTGPKTVRINSVFEVVDVDGVKSPRGVTKDLNHQVEQVTNYDSWCIPAGTVGQQITFGGVVTASRIYLSVDTPITIRLSEVTDAGFVFGPGDGFLSGSITGLWVDVPASPSPDANLEVIIAGSAS